MRKREDRPLVVVAMSGGVDSSVAAALLIEAGYRVRGVSLRLWDSPRSDDRVCSDHRDASRVASCLGIDHVVLDRREDFERRVVEPFVKDYAAGRTPNPCMACNSDFKLGMLLAWALAEGAAAVATGHYARARRENGRVRLLRGADFSRDQSYFLFPLTQRQLEHSLFPLGDLTKAEVRRRARELGLPVADKAESQDLCFGSPAALLRGRGMGGRAGEIVDASHRVLGRHPGLEGFTVGQRRGLGVACGAPLYVQSIDAASNRLTVGDRPPEAREIVAGGWSWIGGRADPGEILAAQVRYRHRGVPARIEPLADDDRCRVRFLAPVTAVAPGQAVVVYRGEELVGGGWIER